MSPYMAGWPQESAGLQGLARTGAWKRDGMSTAHKAHLKSRRLRSACVTKLADKTVKQGRQREGNDAPVQRCVLSSYITLHGTNVG
jgi:hypothetical protein